MNNDQSAQPIGVGFTMAIKDSGGKSGTIVFGDKGIVRTLNKFTGKDTLMMPYRGITLVFLDKKMVGRDEVVVQMNSGMIMRWKVRSDAEAVVELINSFIST